MSHILPIFKKELRSYFNSPIAYIFLTVFLVLSSWLFFRTYFLVNQASMRVFFDLLPWIFLFLVPALTMRLWAEEKKAGTIEVLMTLPIKDYEVVLGKFLASWVFLLIALVLTFILPIIVSATGDPDIGVIMASYIGSLLIGGAFLSIGLYISSLTNNQIIAFIISVAMAFLALIVGSNFVTYSVPSFIAAIFEYLGMANHFDSISRGVIDSRDLMYYLSIIVIFLYLNVRALQARRWK